MIYWLSYLYFPAAPLLIWAIFKFRHWALRAILIMLLVGISTLAYARFIEPRILLVSEHDIHIERCVAEGASARIALFSDTHIGKFGNAMPVTRIAAKIRKIDPDIALVAGDLTYHINPDRVGDTFAPLPDVGAPTYLVLGNHDVGFPGPDYGDDLTLRLRAEGLSVIDNQRLELQINGQPWELIGLSDQWEGEQEVSLVSPPMALPRIVLTHNPETAWLLPDESVDLLMAGHTHGGQILLTEPITCALAPIACNLKRVGLAETSAGKVFVTSGTGMVGLPMRFGVPPTIHVLNVTVPACET